MKSSLHGQYSSCGFSEASSGFYHSGRVLHAVRSTAIRFQGSLLPSVSLVQMWCMKHVHKALAHHEDVSKHGKIVWPHAEGASVFV